MEIRNNSVSGGAQERIDLTRANRDAIRKTIVPEPKSPGLPRELHTDETRKRVHNHRENLAMHERVQGARERHDRVQGARDRIEAKQIFQERAKHAREVLAARGAQDSVEVSPEAQQLADTAVTARPADVDSAVRAQRVSDLKSQYEGGKLDVENLVAETAYRMLGGE